MSSAQRNALKTSVDSGITVGTAAKAKDTKWEVGDRIHIVELGKTFKAVVAGSEGAPDEVNVLAGDGVDLSFDPVGAVDVQDTSRGQSVQETVNPIVRNFPTVAAAKAASYKVGDVVTIEERGGARFKASATGSGDGFSSLLRDDGGYLELDEQDTVSPFFFGEPETDTAAFIAAIDYAKASGLAIVDSRPDARYETTQTLDFRSGTPIEVDIKGWITSHHNDIGVIIGGNSNSGDAPKQSFGGRIIRDVAFTTSGQSNPDVRIVGSKGQHLFINFADYIQAYADTDSSSDGKSHSSAYSTWVIKRTLTMELTNNPTTDGSAVQWINENHIFVNRITSFLSNGTYGHNHNHIWGGNFEGANARITLDKGNSNYFHNVRAEGIDPSNFVSFGTGTFDNRVEISWISSFGGAKTVRSALYNINDQGKNNSVFSSGVDTRREIVVFSADVSDYQASGEMFRQVESGRVPSRKTLKAQTIVDPIFLTDFIKVKRDDVLRAVARGGADPKYRFFIYVYDDDKQPVSGLVLDTDFQSSDTTGSASNYAGGIIGPRIASSSGQDTATVLFLTDTVKYVRVALHASSGQFADQTATRCEVTLSRTNNYDYDDPICRVEGGQYRSLPIVASAPTASIVPAGFSVMGEDGTQYTNVFELITDTSAAATSGATVLTLSDVTGITAGDLIGIEQDDNTTHWTTVASVAGSDVTIGAAITADVAVGSAVYVQRWV